MMRQFLLLCIPCVTTYVTIAWVNPDRDIFGILTILAYGVIQFLVGAILVRRGTPEERLVKPLPEMSDAELQTERERIDDEVRSLNDVLRNLNNEIWLRQFNRDTKPMVSLNDRQERDTDG